MSASGNGHQARVMAIMGATGCGKTTKLRELLARPARKRTVIWSPKEPIDNYAALYPGSIVVRSVSEVLAALKAAKRGPVHLVFWPRLNRAIDEQQFGALCKLVMAARDITLIVDEMHTVTKPSWAPDGWSEAVMMGRGYGLEIFGLSQRPASIDKDFLSNCSRVHVRRLGFDQDAKAVAKTLNVPWQQVMALSGFSWIERDNLSGKVTRG